MRSVKELQAAVDPAVVRAAGAIRRFAVTLTAKVLWQLTGFKFPDGSQEVIKAETFGGIGFYARPPSSSKAEAIVIMLHDDATTPVVVAVRDEKTRAAVVGALAQDESAMFNSAAMVYVKANGTVEVRTPGGAVHALVTVEEHNNHTHPTAGTGSPSTPTVPATGTTVLKGQ